MHSGMADFQYKALEISMQAYPPRMQYTVVCIYKFHYSTPTLLQSIEPCVTDIHHVPRATVFTAALA
jgi:hypothetical protein